MGHAILTKQEDNNPKIPLAEPLPPLPGQPYTTTPVWTMSSYFVYVCSLEYPTPLFGQNPDCSYFVYVPSLEHPELHKVQNCLIAGLFTKILP